MFVNRATSFSHSRYSQPFATTSRHRSNGSHKIPNNREVRKHSGEAPEEPQRGTYPQGVALVYSRDFILPEKEFLYSFSAPFTREKILGGLDLVWQTGGLFSRSDRPDVPFYTQYIYDLLNVVKANPAYFSNLKFSRFSMYGDIDTSFEREFVNLGSKTDLSELQKSICLTQALELALLGVNPAPVLVRINRSAGSHSKGYRNELLAAWYLAKFIYELKPSCLNEFLLSDMLPTYRRNERKRTVSQNVFEREVDIRTQDALVSVKSHDSSFSRQIRDLFFIVIDDEDLDFKHRVQRIILMKSAEGRYQLLPTYMSSKEYRNLEDDAINRARELIKRFPLSQEQEQCFNRLISARGIDIYFLPSVNDVSGLKSFVEQSYAILQAETEREVCIA